MEDPTQSNWLQETRFDLAMGIVPIPSPVITDMAHEESVTSPFFQSRVKDVKRKLKTMLQRDSERRRGRGR